MDYISNLNPLGYVKIGKRSVRIPEQDLQQWIKRNEVILPSIS